MYDRDSFLAGLAVGRTLWRPHKDQRAAPPPPGWDLIEHSTGLLGRNEYYQSSVNVLIEKGESTTNYYSYSPNPSGETGDIVISGGLGNTTAMFNVFVPRRYNKLYVEVKVDTGLIYLYDISGLHIRDAYGINGVYNNGFVGSALKSVYFSNYSMTVEQINNQPGVVINSESQFELRKQVVEIDVSDIDEDMWIGLHRCDNNTTIYSIRAF